MKNLNNKGFAISVVLYATATIMILILILILSVLSVNNKNTLDLTDMIKEQVSGVTGETFQIYNLISNGGFENNSTSWTTDIENVNNSLTNQIDTTIFHSGEKSLKISHNGWQWQKIENISPGDKLYIAYHAYIDEIQNGGLTVSLVNQSKSELPLLEGSYQKKNVTDGFEEGNAITQASDNSNIFLQVGASNKENITGYVDDIIVVNLTTIFGSGGEPSLEWCKTNIQYFNGITTITNYDENE